MLMRHDRLTFLIPILVLGATAWIIYLLRRAKRSASPGPDLDPTGHVLSRSADTSNPGPSTGLSFNVNEIADNMMREALGERDFARFRRGDFDPERVALALEEWMKRQNAEEDQRRRLEETTLCVARTKKGIFCMRRKKPGSDYCLQHRR
jgi:hypothetical protein